MKVQYCSDLHLEFSANRDFMRTHPLVPVGEVLVLAGDIVLFSEMHKHMDFFKFTSDHFHTTWWVPGNHEYYKSDAMNRTGSFCEPILENVFLVNNHTANYEGVQFIFSTLWTHIGIENALLIQQGLSDFELIKYNSNRFTIDDYNRLHAGCLNFITTELTNNTYIKSIVFTHHVPTFMHYPERYKGDALNQAFAVELFDLIADVGPGYWIYGHHHTPTPPFNIGKTQLLTNQLGYVKHNEHGNFDTQKYFTI